MRLSTLRTVAGVSQGALALPQILPSPCEIGVFSLPDRDGEMAASEDPAIGFVKFALSQNVLKFGEFKLKSGRTSPYFFNAGGWGRRWRGADLA